MNRDRSLLYIIPRAVSFLLVVTCPIAVFAQSKAPVKTQTAQKVEDRRPPSEKLAEKRFTWNRKVMQNLVTRYNYYYNAKTKLDGVVKNIARQGLDNYNDLLPFYPYSLQDQGLNENELDSVILKASVAIQIHDPRGKWIDDCYLLIGRAYFYKSDWENARKTFQFMNRSFAPKKKEAYNTVVGSAENDHISIATKEKRKGVIGRLKHKSVRNDAFLWNARTLLEEKEYDEVQSLLNVLEADPNFPRRLKGDLAEVRAYSFYKQGMYAETMTPLRTAISASDNRESRARMSFILGQLYARQLQADSAMDMFREVIRQKPDPMMDFQARVQIARLNVQDGKPGSLESSMAALRKMAKKERYIPFRDAIYYTMADLVAAKDPDAAIKFLMQSLKQESNNPMQKTLSFKAVADIYYNQRQYRQAKDYYDSTATVMPQDFADAGVVNVRKAVLGDVATRVDAIEREDSLQHIAAMPETERQAFLEDMAANIRKAAEEKRKAAAEAAGDNRSYNDNNTLAMNGAFAQGGPNGGSGPADSQGDWYFYNAASKSSGYSEFKRRWGNRQPGDNWRRSQQSSVNFAGNQPEGQTTDSLMAAASAPGEAAGLPPDSVTAQSLATGLPLTPDKLEQSRNIQMDAWFELGKLYHDKLDATELAIEAYDTLLYRFPDHPRKPEVLYSLYVWHGSLKNHTAQANRYKDMVLSQYGNTNFANIIRFGALKDVDEEKKQQISTAYDSAYVAYRSGRYELALERKRQADSTFGFNYLQPKFDLLEAMVIIKTDTTDVLTDSLFLGKKAVEAVINKYPGNEDVRKQAEALLDALNRKKELVTYLAQLQLQKRDSGGTMVDEDIAIRYPWQTPRPNFDSVQLKRNNPTDPTVTADVKVAPPPLKPVKPLTPYKLSATNPHFVVLSFKRVSKVLLDEGLDKFTRYNAARHAADHIEVGSFVLSPTEVMLVFRLFPDENKALDYFDEIRVEAPANIIPRIRPTDYSMFVISRDNFILLNSTKDLQGYVEFFDKNYITQ
ncbi:type IX secretion system periplasmic lipoprotein PorW/SprE [Chitinophaga japonensis]|uniref:Tfp pilus assembly protein PilF n=1 Tax=Chitinophaga japonensis TaxID=104662 RepID=A0A562SJ63_CHIJA|nr:tetratricopeptide repeat protein [Chitinophaga japonensis]TWI81014.1 Tfp pilus assembly protein PilF [Chitinophaga japonensis]